MLCLRERIAITVIVFTIRILQRLIWWRRSIVLLYISSVLCKFFELLLKRWNLVRRWFLRDNGVTFQYCSYMFRIYFFEKWKMFTIFKYFIDCQLYLIERIIRYRMLLKFIPFQIIILNHYSISIHNSHPFGKNVIRINIVRHSLFPYYYNKHRLSSIANILIFRNEIDIYNMGIIRSAPDNEIRLKSQKYSDVNYLEASVCGWQNSMEDYTGCVRLNEKLTLFYVIDGHGGPDIAQITAELIPQILKKNDLITLDHYKTALENLFATLDETLLKEAEKCSVIRQKYSLPPLVDKRPTSGCSAVVVLVGQSEIAIANIGECKAYVCYSSNPSKAVLISGNHSESNKEEENRVKSAGGFFLNGKVNGLFPFTRSLGDYALKSNSFASKDQQLLISSPSVFPLRKEDIKMIVLGSSGLWERTNYVLKQLASDDLELQELQQKAKTTLQQLISKNPKQSQLGLKNISLIVVDVKN